ncbi:thiamine phosphate synthase [Anditalea andensis]|uniref:Thiamine phosphate synthase/TenI domain-containing protein n=1 Tax=Anditalea andensis TaxID=1048983 RepID=A0A074LIW5_9BACT|nr:thiamine phosphate synthase [Anditalea andensis]KEO73737.1 hypothetical protein EL17_09475 [Anditalea andensis]
MELILISSPVSMPDESVRLNDYFHMGLKRFHLRKPYYSMEKTALFLEGIEPRFYSNITLHTHHALGQQYGMDRFHFSEGLRKSTAHEHFDHLMASGKVLSTSVHQAEEFNNLPSIFSYAFIGPVFPSISKKGYGDPFEPKKWKDFSHPSVSSIAIGGVDKNNLPKVKKLGFEGAAILGAIWSLPHEVALKQLEDCIRQLEPPLL